MSDIPPAAAMIVAAGMHLHMFTHETILFARPRTQRMLEIEPQHVPAVRLWAYHQGIYNALLAGIAAAGAGALLVGHRTVGVALTTAAALSMITAAAALVLADRRRARIAGFLAQAAPPAAGLLLLLA